MTVLQHYYTSFINKETGSAGFQVKAMSPGISPEQQALISRMIAYRIPPTLNEYEIGSHPVALRYYYKGPGECVFLCSQSNGNDENGRPGNFFAHTLVMKPTLFASVPPILYWRSPFWRIRDPGSHTQLAALPDFDVEPSLDVDQVWEFLARGNRREQFYKLMCAVVHYNKTQRRIVIIDKNEHVALWIAAVSCMLPPACRPLLSFATYHHDPYQAQFMITGTTSDSSFHASPEEYVSYFILNAEAGRISAIEDSPYAEIAAQAAHADLYEVRLLPLFTDYAQRFPAFTRIDEQLDLLALYANLLLTQHRTTLTPDQVQAIRIAISSFEQQRIYTQEDLEELSELEKILWAAYEAGHDPMLQQEHDRVGVLLKDHQMPTDDLVLKALKDITQQLLRSGAPEQAIVRLDTLCKTYDRELFIAIINRPVYLQWLIQLLEKANAQQIEHIWQCLGSYLLPGPVSQGLLQISLRKVGHLIEQERFEEETHLQSAMKQAMVGHEKEWLGLAVDMYAGLPDAALKRFYYCLVYLLPLEQREPYRQLVQAKQDALIAYEIKSDVNTAGPQRGLAMVERWVEHARHNLYPTIRFATYGIKHLKTICSPQQWHELVPSILKSSILAPLQPEMESELVQEMVSNLTLSQFSSSDMELYKKYQDAPYLPDDTKTVIAGIVAMASGELTQTVSNRLYQRMKMLPVEMYRAETKRFITAFLKAPITDEGHKLMISALFVWEHYTYFWQCYWQTIGEILTSPSEAKRAVDLLAFWFTIPPATFSQRYLLQGFFLELPQQLDEIHKMRGFHEATQAFTTIAATQQWYPLVQNFFSERKNAFVAASQAVGQNVVTQLQKLWSKEQVEKHRQEQEVQAQTQVLATHISSLFEDKKTRELHRQHIQERYSLQQREQFWRLYWQQFVKFLLSQDANQTLDLFAFWFDDTSNLFEQLPYIVQDFFIGLPQTLEMAQKERSFRDASQQVRATALKQRYTWFTLIQPLFIQQEKG